MVRSRESAQIPLHTWLPDAMEGPTPVSALIHAATMVTAGVYLIVRAHPIFELAPSIADLAAGLGAITLLVAGLVALVQTDIKRVIAYSTMSQIGYMFLGAGLRRVRQRDVPPDDARLLQGVALPGRRPRHPPSRRGAGHPQDGRPAQRDAEDLAFLVGSLALVGIRRSRGSSRRTRSSPRRSRAAEYGQFLFVIGLVGTLLTGIHTFRLFFVVFLGEPSELVREHARRGAPTARGRGR